MARDREPILKRCRYLGISPTLLGIDKESNRKSAAGKQKKVSELEKNNLKNTLH